MSEQQPRYGVLVGRCSLCNQEMGYNVEMDDAWHPYDVEEACPPEWFENGILVPQWGRPGRPGSEWFIAMSEEEATEWWKQYGG